MILTCPACSTRYSVDDASLGAKGRSVRCAACGHSWHAVPDGAGGTMAAAAPPPPPVVEPMFEAAPTFDDPPPPAPVAEPEPIAAPVTPHAVFRAKREEKIRKTKLALVGGAWGLVIAALVAGLVVTFLFRDTVVRLWPKSASAFALVGAPVNPFGLEFEKVRLDRQSLDGAPVLSVSGVVRNISDRKQPTRPIELSLLDHKNRVVYSWTVQPEQAQLKPGEIAKFITRIANAPLEAMQIEVTLLASAKDARATGAQVTLKRRTLHAAPIAGAAMPDPLMTGAEMGAVADEGEPFAGHGAAEEPLDPLGADAPAGDPLAADAPPAAPHG